MSIDRGDLMGAWYLLLGFLTLLLLGYPRLKAMLCMLSAQIFILVLLMWQFPVTSFEQSALIFQIIGLRKDSQFGLLVVHHIAVMLMASWYGATYFWLRVHERKMVRTTQMDEFERYQERLTAKQQRKEAEEKAAAEAALSNEEEIERQEDAASLGPQSLNAAPAATASAAPIASLPATASSWECPRPCAVHLAHAAAALAALRGVLGRRAASRLWTTGAAAGTAGHSALARLRRFHHPRA